MGQFGSMQTIQIGTCNYNYVTSDPAAVKRRLEARCKHSDEEREGLPSFTCS